ncbi:tetratricopeptide repeat protein [bacterium]|nr:tetratricopeptide repeat protein [bacterium]
MNTVGTISLIFSGLFFFGYVLLLRVHRFRHLRNTLLILSSALVLFGLFNAARRRPLQSIAVIPSLHQYGERDASVALMANTALRRRAGGSVLVKDMSWFNAAVEPDSLFSSGYCARFFSAAGVTVPVLISVRDTLGNGMALACEICGGETQEPDIHADTLFYDDPGRFFSSLANRLIHEPVQPSGTEYGLRSGREWALLGEARRNELFGSRSSALSTYARLDALQPGVGEVVLGLSRTLIAEGCTKKAEGRFAEDDFLRAKQLLLSYTSRDTADADAFTLLGTIAVYREEWNQAQYYLGKALSLDRNDPAALMALSRLHEKRIHELGFRSRMALYTRILELNPADVTAVLAAGETYYFRNLPHKAIRLYRRLLQLDPNSIDALMALGKIYVLKNDVLNIISTYERILALRPDYGDAFYNLGIAYFNDEKPEQAAGLFKRALELNGNRDSHYYLGVIFFRQGQRDSAIEQLRARIREKTGFDDTYAEESRRLLYRILNDSTYTL